MRKILQRLTVGIIMLLIAKAQAQSADSLIVQGKKLVAAGLEAWEAAPLQKARAHFERLLASKQHEALLHYYLGYCDYRLTIYYQQQANPDLQKKHLEEALAHLEKAVKLNNKFAEAYALLSSGYGQKIAMAPMLGMTFGPRSQMAMQSGLQLAPNNPRVILLDAIGTYYKPPMFGGSKEKALAGFKRAAELFDQEKIEDPLLPDWGHPEAYAWLGVAYIDKNDLANARTALERALTIAPNYGWVKHQLYPEVAAAKP